MLVRDFGQRFRIRLHTGRRFSMHEGEHFHAGVGFESVADFIRIDRRAPSILNHDRDAAAAFDVLHHAPAEYAVDAHDYFIARLDQINEAAFHAH